MHALVHSFAFGCRGVHFLEQTSLVVLRCLLFRVWRQDWGHMQCVVSFLLVCLFSMGGCATAHRKSAGNLVGAPYAVPALCEKSAVFHHRSWVAGS